MAPNYTLPLSDSNRLGNNRNSTDPELDKTEHPIQVIFAPKTPKSNDPETYEAWCREWKEYRDIQRQDGRTEVLVLAKPVIISQTYDPNTYDPNGRTPWTPEPEPYDPETYAAWGREHFGEDWYQLRKTTLQERNYYMRPDPIYGKRQRVLRVLEHIAERRPFKPRAGVLDEDWKRLWARLSKDLPDVETSSPTPLYDSDSETDLSGYDTYAPTPEPHELTPFPEDRWERLEYHRKHLFWDEEQYQFERIFLKEFLIDEARVNYENEEGCRRREKELEEIEKIKYIPGTCFHSDEYERRMRHFNLRAEGWTQEQVDADEQEIQACRKEAEEQLLRELLPLPNQPQALQPVKKVRGGRVTKNVPRSRSHGAARPGWSAPTSTEAAPPKRRRRRSKSDLLKNKTQTATIRASRRLAGLPPELPGEA